jgi:hypothetical protein
MNRRRFARHAFALALSALATACAGRPETRATGLLDTLRRHHEHLRWENYGAAATQVDAPFRAEWSQLTAQIGRVSDYELGGIDMKDPPGDDAQVIVKIAGFRVPDMTVRTHVLRERWRRDGDHWRLSEMAPAQPNLPGL